MCATNYQRKKTCTPRQQKQEKKNGFSLGYGALGEESEVRENEKEMCEKTGNRRTEGLETAVASTATER